MEITENIKSTFGFFKTSEEAKMAMRALKKSGFNNSDIYVLYPETMHKEFTAHERRQVLIGAIIGAVLGFMVILAISAVISLGFFHLEAFARFTSTQILFIVFMGSGLGVLIGAACGALVGIGTPKRAAVRYGDYVGRSGGVLVSVRTPNSQQETKAHDVLERTGGNDIKSLTDEDKSWQTIIEEKRFMENGPSTQNH